MFYPNEIHKGDCFGVTATSDGFSKEIDSLRFYQAKKRLEEMSYAVKYTNNIWQSEKGRSGTGQERAEQFMHLIEDEEVKAIMLAKGGDYLCQMLPYLDFSKIKANPKWIQGYSDSTGILFTLTTMCDIATLYGNHFNDFAMKIWHKSIENDMQLLSGKPIVQHSFSHYENQFYDRVTGDEGYVLEKKVQWKSVSNKPECIKGRMIGGCMDVLADLLGTPFDHVKEFCERYKHDGIVWVVESFSFNDADIIRKLWQMRQAGWFSYVRGFVFGRPCFFQSTTGYSYEDAVVEALGDLNVPILLNCDVGHRGPQFTLMLGGYGVWNYDGQNGTLQIVQK